MLEQERDMFVALAKQEEEHGSGKAKRNRGEMEK
jgi:hypothetical protein